MRIAVDAIVELKEERSRILNAVYVATVAEKDTAQQMKELDAFNTRWPEEPITMKELREYIRRQDRDRKKDQTTSERIAGKRYAPMLPK